MTTPVTRCAHHGHIDCCVCGGPAHAGHKPPRFTWGEIAFAVLITAIFAAPWVGTITGH